MLIPLQSAGTRPPLFFIHGMNGLMSLGATFVRALGPNQPFYAIHADGIDGRRPVLDDMRQIVSSYVADIQAARPHGVIRIGAMCTGCVIAIEVANRMVQSGRQIAPVVLVDPPPLPRGYDRRIAKTDPSNPKIAARLYEQSRRTLLEHALRHHNDAPFDPSDPEQIHNASLAGAGMYAAFARYKPSVFRGPAELIVAVELAAGFFHPQMPWHKLLPGPRLVHVLPWDHTQIFRQGLKAVCRFLKFVLDGSAVFAGASGPDVDFDAKSLERRAPSNLPAQPIA